MQVDEFILRYPLLFHLAAGGSWPRFIELNAALSTSRILDLASLDADARAAIERTPRRTAVTVDGFVIRDQTVLSASKLARILDGMTVEEWCLALNRRFYFWPNERKLLELVGARNYGTSWHDVLVVSTERLVAQHLDRIRVAAINGGATLFDPAPRGLQTYRSIGAHTGAVAEVCVEDAVEPLLPSLVRVERRRAGHPVETVWVSP